MQLLYFRSGQQNLFWGAYAVHTPGEGDYGGAVPPEIKSYPAVSFWKFNFDLI